MRRPALPCALLCAALLAACASRPTPLPRLAPGDTLSFEVWGRAAGGPVPVRNEEVGNDAKKGGGAGGAMGAAAGLGCGFLAVACVPIFAALGVGAGSATGGLVGLTGALPPEQRERVVARVGRQLKVRDLHEYVEQDIVQRASQRWKLEPGSATAQLLLEMRSIELSSNRAGQVGLSARVRTTVRLRALPQGEPPFKEYTCAVAPSPVETWLDETSDHVARQVADCSRQLADQIVAELAPA
jgi:hypothetical protein